MTNFADRSDCNKRLFPATDEVTKKVLDPALIFAGSALRGGIAILSGAKARLFVLLFGTSEDVP